MGDGGTYAAHVLEVRMTVLGIGHCTLDYIGVVDRFVETDALRELDQFSTQGGGAAATAVVALARWGVDASFIGKVGDDVRGAEIVRTLADEGVDVQRMVQQRGGVSQLAMTVVERTTGRKQGYVTRGTVEALTPGEVGPDVLDGVTVLLCDGTHGEVEVPLMRAAKDRGITVMLDATTPSPHIAAAVAAADYLVASERFASQYAGVGELESLCRALLEQGPSTVVVTLGNEGCVAMSTDGVLHRQPAHAVEVLDTTGAGDVFHGGVLYGVVNGWELPRVLSFATIAAGLSCTALGGRSRIASVAEIELLLQK